MARFLRSHTILVVMLFLLGIGACAVVAWAVLASSVAPTTMSEADSVSAASSSKSSSTSSRSSSSMSSSTSRATGDGVDDFGVCTTEGKEYCSGFYTEDWSTWATAGGYTNASWKLGLVDCLSAHETENSDACNASLDRRAALNTDVNTFCADDRATYCAGVEPRPGSEPQVDCLKENYSKLVDACAAAVDAHEEAKPVSQQDYSYRE